jgi:hypothetical protein
MSFTPSVVPPKTMIPRISLPGRMAPRYMTDHYPTERWSAVRIENVVDAVTVVIETFRDTSVVLFPE